MMRWIHKRDFGLMEKTLDPNMTPEVLISSIGNLMRNDSIFSDFLENYIEGDEFLHFVEDTQGLDEYEVTEKADELLQSLYDYADSERIAL